MCIRDRYHSALWPIKVIQGQWFSCHLKANVRLPISDQQQPSTIHPWQTDGQINRQITSVPIARSLLKYSRLKNQASNFVHIQISRTTNNIKQKRYNKQQTNCLDQNITKRQDRQHHHSDDLRLRQFVFRSYLLLIPVSAAATAALLLTASGVVNAHEVYNELAAM